MRMPVTDEVYLLISVTRAVPQGSVLDPVLSFIFLIHLCVSILSKCNLSADIDICTGDLRKTWRGRHSGYEIECEQESISSYRTKSSLAFDHVTQWCKFVSDLEPNNKSEKFAITFQTPGVISNVLVCKSFHRRNATQLDRANTLSRSTALLTLIEWSIY